MCGRYVLYAAPHKLKDLLGALNLPNFPQRYNATPLQEMPILIRDRLGMARWGFTPSWGAIDDIAAAAKMINARSETVPEKLAFRESWRKARRCVIPANGYFEWKKDAITGDKQPYYIYRKDQQLLCFAGLWSKVGDAVTFTVLTKPADGKAKELHHRSPVMIDSKALQQWFAANDSEAQAMIAKSSAALLSFHPVGHDVGKVANDSERLIEPVKIYRQEALAI